MHLLIFTTVSAACINIVISNCSGKCEIYNYVATDVHEHATFEICIEEPNECDDILANDKCQVVYMLNENHVVRPTYQTRDYSSRKNKSELDLSRFEAVMIKERYCTMRTKIMFIIAPVQKTDYNKSYIIQIGVGPTKRIGPIIRLFVVNPWRDSASDLRLGFQSLANPQEGLKNYCRAECVDFVTEAKKNKLLKSAFLTSEDKTETVAKNCDTYEKFGIIIMGFICFIVVLALVMCIWRIHISFKKIKKRSAEHDQQIQSLLQVSSPACAKKGVRFGDPEDARTQAVINQLESYESNQEPIPSTSRAKPPGTPMRPPRSILLKANKSSTSQKPNHDEIEIEMMSMK